MLNSSLVFLSFLLATAAQAGADKALTFIECVGNDVTFAVTTTGQLGEDGKLPIHVKFKENEDESTAFWTGQEEGNGASGEANAIEIGRSKLSAFVIGFEKKPIDPRGPDKQSVSGTLYSMSKFLFSTHKTPEADVVCRLTLSK